MSDEINLTAVAVVYVCIGVMCTVSTFWGILNIDCRW